VLSFNRNSPPFSCDLTAADSIILFLAKFRYNNTTKMKR